MPAASGPTGPARSAAFDRIVPGRPPRDRRGKEALYSTAPSAGAAPQVDARCRRCGTHLGMSVVDLLRLLAPPFVVDPVRRRVFTRCPACRQRAWLEVAAGQPLRVLLHRRRDGDRPG